MLCVHWEHFKAENLCETRRVNCTPTIKCNLFQAEATVVGWVPRLPAPFFSFFFGSVCPHRSILSGRKARHQKTLPPSLQGRSANSRSWSKSKAQEPNADYWVRKWAFQSLKAASGPNSNLHLRFYANSMRAHEFMSCNNVIITLLWQICTSTWSDGLSFWNTRRTHRQKFPLTLRGQVALSRFSSCPAESDNLCPDGTTRVHVWATTVLILWPDLGKKRG